jgi:hypothetical protein
MSQPTIAEQAIELVKATQHEVNELLKGPEYIHNLLGINAQFTLILNRLKFVNQILTPGANKKEAKAEAAPKRFGPIKTFMGEPIKREKPITKTDLTADEKKRLDFVKKVEKLYDSISGIDTNIILNSYTINDDKLILRGVAKRANVKGWKDRDINADYVNDIKLGIQIIAEEVAKQEEIDRKIREQDEKRSSGAVDDLDDDDIEDDVTDTDVDDIDEEEEETEDIPVSNDATQPTIENPLFLTKEIIDADDDLKKRLRAKAGQWYFIDDKGVKQIRKDKPVIK